MDGKAGKRTDWEKRIAEWERSSQSQKAFCAQRGLALSTFQWWRAQTKRREPSAPAFLPMAMGVSTVEIELRSRTRLRFEGEAALRAVEHLVARVK